MIYRTVEDVRGELRIDSHDLIELRTHLQSELDRTELRRRGDLYAAIVAIDELAREVGSEWTDGVMLIRADTFADYAYELAEELGLIPDEFQWPAYWIDWARAADDLAQDYIDVTLFGHDYKVRA